MSIPTDDDRSRRARALFDAQVDALDGATATALRARRREALAAMPAGRRAAWWWPAGGVAIAALAMALWLPREELPTPDRADASPVAATDAAARFADSALLELENDADFYAWLATVPDDTGHDADATAPPNGAPHEGLTL